MALAQGLVIGLALWGLLANFVMWAVSGLAGAIVAWAITLALGAGLGWRARCALRLAPRYGRLVCSRGAGAVLGGPGQPATHIDHRSRYPFGPGRRHTGRRLAARPSLEPGIACVLPLRRGLAGRTVESAIRAGPGFHDRAHRRLRVDQLCPCRADNPGAARRAGGVGAHPAPAHSWRVDAGSLHGTSRSLTCPGSRGYPGGGFAGVVGGHLLAGGCDA